MRGLRSLLILVLLAAPAVSALADAYAVVSPTGCTENTILWDGAATYTPPPGTTLVPAASAPASCPVANPTTIPIATFLLRFTPAEFVAIKGSADPQVQQYLFVITTSPSVSLTDPIVTGGVAYLVTINLLTQARATTILTP